MKYFLSALLLSSITFTAVAETAHKHESSKQHAVDQSALTLNKGKKWEIDQTMKANMEKINATLNEVLKKKNPAEADYHNLYTVVQTSTQDIVANCKMEPKMDEAFHVVLAEMLNSAEELKSEAKQKHAPHMMKKSIKKYTEFFNHKI